MKQHTKAPKLPNDTTSKRPRFTIEKLEERIAPAKGGLPGPGNGGRGGHNHSWGKS